MSDTWPPAAFAAPDPGRTAGAPGPAQPPDEDPLGLAVTALVLGVVALPWCWVPLVGVLSGLCALPGLGVGAGVLVSAGRRRRGGAATWMALAGTVLSAVSLLVSGLAVVSTARGVVDFIHCADRSPCGA